MHVLRRGSVVQVRKAVIASLLIVSSALGQPASERPARDHAAADALCVYGGTSGALWLVRMDAVAKELALTPEQAQQFARWEDELNAENRRIFRGLVGGTGPDHDRRAAEKQRRATAVAEAFHRRVLARLDPRQRARLDELYIRLLGPRALFEPRIVERLGLSTSQQQALRDAVGAGSDPPPYEKLLELLSEAQRQQLTALQGAAFTFPKPHFIRLGAGAAGHRK